MLGPKGGPTSSLFLKQRKGSKNQGSYPQIDAKTGEREARQCATIGYCKGAVTSCAQSVTVFFIL